MTRHRVGMVQDLERSHPLIVSVNGAEIGIYRVRGELVAWRNICPHQGVQVCKGRIAGTRLPSDVYEYAYGRDGEILQCPLHGWEFDLTTGQHLSPGSTARLRRFPVEVDGDAIYIHTRTYSGG